jgi:DNA polymerase-1
VTLARELADSGVAKGEPVALVVADAGIALAWRSGERVVPSANPVGVVAELAGLDPRWTWWSARETAPALVAAGVRPRTCWDLEAVGRLIHGLRRGDAGAVWAAQHGLPEPTMPRGELDLLELGGEDGAAVRPDGQLSREWLRGRPLRDLAAAQRWAALALTLQAEQQQFLQRLPDPRAAPRRPTLAELTATAESAAALLAVELEHDGLPLDRTVATELLAATIGQRPGNEAQATAQRAARDDVVLRHFPDRRVDLRSPQQVRPLLAAVGLDLPDTRSWRLAPYADSVPAVAALLHWRKAERLATTYGWSWLDEHVGADGRLRGRWGAADAAAGRMTAQAGLHNLPAELRPAVLAEPGHVFVRADLGQVEPRVLAAVSHDDGFAAAARADDIYAPVASKLGCDRPTAKVAVLAAMYGQTSGAAGAALADMDRAFPRAMAYLRAAEQAERDGTDVRTYGGRLLRPWSGGPDAAPGSGRFFRNAVIQGAAAELFKAWAATVRDGLAPLGASIVLCLHDELLVHVPDQSATAVRDLLHQGLDSTVSWWAAGSGVRFVADVAVGRSWADAR